MHPESPIERFLDKIKGLFGGGSSDPSSPTPTGTDSEPIVLTDESTASEDTSKSSGLEVTIPLTIDFEFGPTPPMTPRRSEPPAIGKIRPPHFLYFSHR
jgi:hypothetical protein